MKHTDPAGIDISFSAGAAHIFFSKLPADIQQKYGYDPVKGDAFLQQQAQDQMQTDAMVQQQLVQQAADAAKKRAADAEAEKASASLPDILKSANGLIFNNIEIVDQGFTSPNLTHAHLSQTMGSYETIEYRYCLVTEIDTSNLATNQTWVGTVWRVGTTKIGNTQYTHYTANIKAWAKAQGL